MLGYVGAVSSWFDVELVREVARQFADWDVVIAGPIYPRCGTAMPARPSERASTGSRTL